MPDEKQVALESVRKAVVWLQVWRHTRDRALLRAYRAGATHEEIARVCGLSPSRVGEIVRYQLRNDPPDRRFFEATGDEESS